MKQASISMAVLDQAAKLIHARETQKTRERRGRQIASLAQRLRIVHVAAIRGCSFSQIEKELENSSPPAEWLQTAELFYSAEFGGSVPELMTATIRTNVADSCIQCVLRGNSL